MSKKAKDKSKKKVGLRLVEWFAMDIGDKSGSKNTIANKITFAVAVLYSIVTYVSIIYLAIMENITKSILELFGIKLLDIAFVSCFILVIKYTCNSCVENELAVANLKKYNRKGKCFKRKVKARFYGMFYDINRIMLICIIVLLFVYILTGNNIVVMTTSVYCMAISFMYDLFTYLVRKYDAKCGFVIKYKSNYKIKGVDVYKYLVDNDCNSAGA